MAGHVAFLVRLTLLWSAVTGLVGLALLAFALAAVTLVFTAGGQPPGSEVAAGVTAATLGVVALSSLAWAAVHLVAGRGLAARRPWARLLALLLALFNVLLLPLGTALAAYTLWVLLQEDARRQFVYEARGRAPGRMAPRA